MKTSYLLCDRTFGSIEKKLRKTSHIYSPLQYVLIIGKAVKKGFPACQLAVDMGFPEGFIKTDYCPADVEGNIIKVRLMKGRGRWVKEKFDISQEVLSPKYLHDRLLAPEKVNDLRSLLSLLEGRAQKWLQALIARQDNLRGAGEVQQREVLVDNQTTQLLIT
ncbi:hypothetical protein Hamer_G002963 [Homarus americanus]|uniref:Uncharacterized protein n=1 Tax=Homarus americanus TaxID=6706 RepID=A0A8J5JX11_HOMAM|nr:hypothetical protein Hamer_G002963 [Homarus americanus]